MSRAVISLTTGLNSKQLQESTLVSNALLGGTVQLWEWIGDGATTFSY